MEIVAMVAIDEVRNVRRVSGRRVFMGFLNRETRLQVGLEMGIGKASWNQFSCDVCLTAGPFLLNA